MDRYEARSGRTALWLAVLALVGAAAPVRAEQQELGQFSKAANVTLRAGESRQGDLYAFGNSVSISGLQDGDLVAFAQGVTVSGEVTGDLIAWSANLNVTGKIGDSVRAGAQTMLVSGRIEGDLLAFAQVVTLTADAHVTGNVRVFGGEVNLDGTIDGDLDGIGGVLRLSGSVGGDTSLEFDRIDIDPGSRIAGDLAYTSRNQIELADDRVVGGEVVFKPKQKQDEGPRAGARARAVLGWAWRVVLAVVIGSMLLGLTRRIVLGAGRAVGEEALLGTLIGFGSSIVTPVAAVIGVVLLILVPLALIGVLTTGDFPAGPLLVGGVLSLFCIALVLIAMYLAKLPVALWLGQRLLGGLGRRDASPYLALAIGTVPLYVLFAVPFLGFLGWLFVAWLGLGATILSLRRLGGQPGGGGTAPAIDAAPSEPAR